MNKKYKTADVGRIFFERHTLMEKEAFAAWDEKVADEHVIVDKEDYNLVLQFLHCIKVDPQLMRDTIERYSMPSVARNFLDLHKIGR